MEVTTAFLYLRNPRLREAMSPAQGHTSVRSGRFVCQGPSSKSVPGFRSFAVVQRRHGVVRRDPRPRIEGRQPKSKLCGKVGEGGTLEATWSPVSCRHIQEDQPRPTGRATGSEITTQPQVHTCGTLG